MRSVDPETGKPYPRKRAIDWAFIARSLAYRKERAKMAKAGYVERGILRSQVADDWGKKIVDAVPSADGQSVFVKIVTDEKARKIAVSEWINQPSVGHQAGGNGYVRDLAGKAIWR